MRFVIPIQMDAVLHHLTERNIVRRRYAVANLSLLHLLTLLDKS
jgi:hypothetical protein